MRKGARKKEFHVGLDIGTRLIKCAEVLSDDSTRKLTKFNFAEIEPPQNPEKVLDALKELLEKVQPSAKEVNISLSAPSAIVRFINMPKMKKEDLTNSLRFEAEKYIPFNINEVLIDASILEDNPDDKNQMRVLLAAAKKDVVNSRIEMLKKLGISVAVIDVDSFACFNAFCDSFDPSTGSGPPQAGQAEPGPGKLDESKSTAILNIGYSQTNVIISRGKQPFFTRDMQIGGKDIAGAISKGLGVEEKDADKLIFDPKERGPEVYETAKAVLGNLVDETRLSFGYYENQFGKSIEQIYISGGIARLSGILNYFEENFGMKPIPWNPFSKFEIDTSLDAKLLERVRPQFAVCAGLAIRK
jgi:type IV pilus assembly protein PilM